MKSPFILLALLIAAGFSSCSVYRSGQTPDDVYYSPGRTGGGVGGGDEYVDVRERQSSRYQSGSRYNNYDDNYYDDDAYLRMRVRNYNGGGFNRWNYFDNYWNDYGMYNSFGPSWGIGLGMGMGMGYGGWGNPWYSPWNSWNMGYNHWNNWYNPYYPGVIIVNPKDNPGMYSKIRNFSLNSYSNSYNNRNAAVNGRSGRSNYRLPSGGTYNNSNRYNNGNRNSSFGGAVRKAFSGSGNNSGRSYNNNSGGSYGRPDRTYSPPSNNTSTNSSRGSYGGGSSGSSSGSGGGGGGISRPGRN